MRTGNVNALLAGGLVLAALAVSGCPADQFVVFPDPALDVAVRNALSQPLGFLKQSDLLRLNVLDAHGMGVRNLRGLENARNLIWLDLGDNEIVDLTPLRDLNNIMTLNLDTNGIVDITPLANLRSLDQVYLANNPIPDISALVTNAENAAQNPAEPDGLGTGDYVSLSSQFLSTTALTVQVPRLEELGVIVDLDGGSK